LDGSTNLTGIKMRAKSLNTSMIARRAAAALLALAVAAVSEARPAAVAPFETEAPAGTYTLDKAHATLVFRVDHIGFSSYTAQFDRFDATLRFDPANPALSSVNASVDVSSLDLPTPPAGFLDTLLGAAWFDAARFPQITFRSTGVEPAAPNQMRIHGELEFRGVKRPVTLDAVFNGGYAGHPLDPQARIGFSARGTLRRSEFGMAEGLPPPGTKMGVSDAVEILIDAEFNGPKLETAAE
jgi:polyisoprenoid-binding protein YceI